VHGVLSAALRDAMSPSLRQRGRERVAPIPVFESTPTPTLPQQASKFIGLRDVPMNSFASPRPAPPTYRASARERMLERPNGDDAMVDLSFQSLSRP